MRKNKTLFAIFITIFLITILFLSYYFLHFKKISILKEPEQLIGGQKDAHGCLIGAGYSWCEVKQKCLRIWEEKCEAETIDKTADWQTYANTKYKFELKLPLTWEGFKASTGDYSTYSYVGFSFGNPHQPFTIFQILSYTKEQWNAVINKSLVKVLAQLENQILVCDGCCNVGEDSTGGGQFDEFQIQRCKDVPDIIKTFKTTN